MPNSCAHVAGECTAPEAHRISRHNAACQIVHAAIRKTAKEGEALHNARNVLLVVAESGKHYQTSEATLESLPSETLTKRAPNLKGRGMTDWLEPLSTVEEILSENTRMSHMIPDTLWGTPPPTTETRNARQLRTVAPAGFCQRKRRKYSSRRVMARARTSSTIEGYQTPPSPGLNSFDREACTLNIS